jgi:hypothetical protein
MARQMLSEFIFKKDVAVSALLLRSSYVQSVPTSGVPQGSELRSIPLLILINDLANVLSCN